ncbi:MAG: ATP-binding protein [Candidatus Hodarchaeales archaeon]
MQADNRLRMPLGTVIATHDSPSTQKLDFVLNDDHLLVFRGEFVEISSSEKAEQLVLAKVGEVKKLNAYFSSADSVKVFEHNRPLEGIFPTDEWNYVLCSARPLGILEHGDDKIQTVRFPVSPGYTVYRARPATLSKFLGFKPDGLHLGDLDRQRVEVRPDISRLLHKHLAILAISGGGKSYAATVLLEELLHQSPQAGRLAMVVIDPHGEYAELYGENGNGILDNIRIERGSYFQVGVGKLSAWSFREFAPEMSVVQVRELGSILARLKASKKPYGLREIIQRVSESESIGTRTKESLTGWLYTLENTRLFGYEENPNLDHLLSSGKLVIFDLADILSLKSKQIACAYIARRLFDLRRKQQAPPFLLLVEEAHQFCPEGISSISRGIIETIAREGRKFFASLGLISQRPVRLSTTALSQCNSHLILRIRNPYDLEFIGRTSEGLDKDSLSMLPDLEIGTGMLVGEAVNYPVLFRIRQRTLEREGRFSRSLRDEARQFDPESTS